MARSFQVPINTADTVADLSIEQIFQRFGCPLQIVSDNGSENVNKAVKGTLAKFKIDHTLTSDYQPRSNTKVERFHRNFKTFWQKW